MLVVQSQSELFWARLIVSIWCNHNACGGYEQATAHEIWSYVPLYILDSGPKCHERRRASSLTKNVLCLFK